MRALRLVRRKAADKLGSECYELFYIARYRGTDLIAVYLRYLHHYQER